MTTTLHPARATQLEIARRNARRLAHEVLNPDERMIWSGYCESKVGQQSKAVTGRAAGAILAIFVFFVTMVGLGSILNVILGMPYGFALAFPIAVLLLWKFGERPEMGRDGKMYCRQQTVYALTNERALVFRNCNQGVPVRSVPLRFIDRVRVVGDRGDGRGTVEFLSWDASAGKWTCPVRFVMVEKPNRVLDHVEAIASGGE